MKQFNPNPTIPLLDWLGIIYNIPISGYLHCIMEDVLGWGLGVWRIQITIDLNKNEYNTKVCISFPENHGLSKIGAEHLKTQGIELTDKELRTIIRLFRSRRYKKFLKNHHSGRYFDAGWLQLRLFDTDDIVILHSERFDFFKRNRLPRNRFQIGALWWTRGLRHIYERMRDMA